jgi:hypothetical protein
LLLEDNIYFHLIFIYKIEIFKKDYFGDIYIGITYMAYVPPQRRKNTFVQERERKKSLSPPPIIEENFPELGSTINKSESKMNFAASITSVQPKEEVVKEVEDGWVRIRKNKEPKYLFGKVSDRILDVLSLVEIINEQKRMRVLYNMEDRLDYYQWLDEELNGPKYLSGYEITLMLEEQERERKQQLKENDESSSSSEESDYETVEFN